MRNKKREKSSKLKYDFQSEQSSRQMTGRGTKQIQRWVPRVPRLLEDPERAFSDGQMKTTVDADKMDEKCSNGFPASALCSFPLPHMLGLGTVTEMVIVRLPSAFTLFMHPSRPVRS